MPWSSRFVDALRAGQSPRLFRVEFDHHMTGISRSAHLSGVPGDPSGPLVLSARAPSVSGTSIGPGSWSPSWGAASVDVVGPDFASAVLPRLRRGALCTVFAGFTGWTPAEFQPIFRGTLRGITGNARNAWTLELWDVLAGYRTRQTTDPGSYPDPANPSQFPLFWDLSVPVALTTAYLPGDAFLDVTDAAPCNGDRDPPSSPGALVRISPAGGGAPFYLPWTSKVGNQLQGVAAAGVLGTTAIAAASGSTVQPVAWLRGHPVELARRLLLSGLTDRTSAWNQWPSSWCFGHGFRESWIDLADMLIQEALIVVDSSGTPGRYSWEVVQESPVDDAIGWFQGLLSAAGIWLVQRQGQITVRACQDADGAGGAQPNGTIFRGNVTITEADLIAVEGWEGWAASSPYVAGVSAVLTSQGQKGRGAARVDSLPAVDVVQHNQTGTIRSAADWEAMADGDLFRLQKWDLSAPEVLSLSLRFWPAAGLVAGDVLRVHLPALRGRLPSTVNGYRNREGTVLVASPDWGGQSVRVQIAIQPYLSELSPR
jgi:hypothetical protein